MERNLKRESAAASIPLIENGMKLGLGSGSTAEELVKLLADEVKNGLSVITVATSVRTANLARSFGIKVSDLDQYPHLDLTIDGADELDANLQLIKGGGAAHLREKIVAHASDRLVIIADESKLVSQLGKFPLPLEVIPFGLEATKLAIEKVLGSEVALKLRMYQDEAVTTDSDNLVLDAFLEHILDAKKLATTLSEIPGIVEHGLFINYADTAFVAGIDGVTELHKDNSN